jgi:hypothetical protein
MESSDINVIRDAKAKLERASHSFAEKLYKQGAEQYAQSQSQQQSDTSGTTEESTQGGEKVYDADYEVVDEDKKK